MVMVSHAAYPKLKNENGPASLSPYWIQDILRRRIGYRGMVISDDLEMQAVLKLGIESAAVGTVAAGADIYMVCHDAGLITRAYEAVLREAERSSAFRRKVQASAARLRRAKASARRSEASKKSSRPQSLGKLRESFQKLAEECAKA
jgi:beta-N-acetylhexosaminidase